MMSFRWTELSPLQEVMGAQLGGCVSPRWRNKDRKSMSQGKGSQAGEGLLAR